MTSATISISSSSEEESGSGSGSGSEAESEEDESVSDDEYDGDDDDSKGTQTVEERCNKVIDLLRGRKNLNMLTLDECKAYLRKHELRISGTKDTCIKRILEHWRLKDGNAETLYPRSSFVVNCTGDVCTGDVVLFKQKVYEKFDIVKRGGGGKVIGERRIAGRVVKESYGVSKQQHTFSVEVLWSNGVKALPLLSPLLVKGRNLYRLKTFRQRWSNEGERWRILAEKHRRGAAARHTRAIAKSVSNKGSKLKRKSSTTNTPPNKKRRIERAKKAPLDHANTRAHAKPHGGARTARNSESFTTDPQMSSYQHPNGYQRYPFEVNREIHPIHATSYNMGPTSSSGVRIPYGHTLHNHYMGQNVHNQVINRPSYVSHPYENPRFHGWRGP